MEIRKIWFKEKGIYLILSMLSVVVFLCIYGISVINPLYDDWLLSNGEDITQHYLAWIGFRKSAWFFPIGMTDKLSFPNLTSVVFTDSIPLFAVFFKMLSPILPSTFQYFGIWGVMCFILQSCSAAKILRKYTDNWLVIICGSSLLLFNPVFLERMYTHTSLAAQWIIIYGIGELITWKKNSDIKKSFISIALLAFLSSTVHMYYVLMSGIILIGICFIEIFDNRNIIRAIEFLAEYLIVTACIIYLLGGFSSAATPQDIGLGIFSLNINGFFNPQTWSCILQNLPLYGTGQNYEGMNYLGFGNIFLFLLSVSFLAGNGDMIVLLRKKCKLVAAVSIVFLIALAFALSPLITYGDRLILEIPLPDIIKSKWSIFRATGRVAWICVYIIEICMILFLIDSIHKARLVVVVLGLSLALQVYDLHKSIGSIHTSFKSMGEYDTMLDSYEFWNTIGEDNEIKHIVYQSKPTLDYLFSLTDWALEYGKTVSDFHFARISDKDISQDSKLALENCPVDSLFIFPVHSCDFGYNLHYYFADNLIIGYADKIPGFTEIWDRDFIMNWVFENNDFLFEESGQDTGDGREIYPGGFSYGPYWSVPAGEYQINIFGKDIPEELDVTINNGGIADYDYEIANRTEDTISVKLKTDNSITDFEVIIINNADHTALVNSLQMYRIL